MYSKKFHLFIQIALLNKGQNIKLLRVIEDCIITIYMVSFLHLFIKYTCTNIPVTSCHMINQNICIDKELVNKEGLEVWLHLGVI